MPESGFEIKLHSHQRNYNYQTSSSCSWYGKNFFVGFSKNDKFEAIDSQSLWTNA